MVISGIYCIENITNNKKYIGQSKDIYKRWKEHKRELINNRHCNSHLQGSWNKYGQDSFKFTIIEECDISVLNERELYHINSFQSHNSEYGYNLTYGGDNNKVVITDKLKSILRASHAKEFRAVNMYLGDGTFIRRFENMVDAAKFVNGTESGVRNNANGFSLDLYTGRKYKGYCWVFDEDIDKFKSLDYEEYFSLSKFKVNKYEYPSGKFVCQYKSIADAAKDNNISIDVVSLCVRGVQNRSGAYTYRNANKEDGYSNIKITVKEKAKRLNPVVAFYVDSNKVYNCYDNILDAFYSGDFKNTSHISGCCRGSRKTAYGYKWMYIKDVDFSVLSDTDNAFLLEKYSKYLGDL